MAYKKVQKYPRITIPFYGDNLKFAQYAAWRNRMSINQYINMLLEQDMKNYDRKEWDTPDDSAEED